MCEIHLFFKIFIKKIIIKLLYLSLQNNYFRLKISGHECKCVRRLLA